jgi:hypothetical protein
LASLSSSPPEGKPGLQVIQTTFNGIRYRSRNEARFSALLQEIFGDSIVYEPEGFVLPSGAYLPDFALVDSVGQAQIFFEIKGYDLPLEDAQNKLRELSEITSKPCILFVGFPLNHHITIYWMGKEVSVKAKPNSLARIAANLRFEQWDKPRELKIDSRANAGRGKTLQ